MEAAQTQTQMNVRIDAEQKAGGDAVLAQFGLNPTYAVRSLWEYLAAHKALPDFMAGGDSREAAEPTYAALADEGAGLAVRLAQEAGIACGGMQVATYEDLRDAAYEDRFDAWESRGE